MLRKFSAILVLLLVLTVIALGFAGYGYTQLKTSLSIQKLEPHIGLSIGSLGTALIDLVSGNLSGDGVSGIVEGLSFDGAINMHNLLPIPLYIPNMTHYAYINGHKCQDVIRTKEAWIAPFGDISWPCSLLLETKDVSPLLLNAIGKGGDIEIVIASEMNLGGITINKSTTKQYMLESLLSRISSGSSGTAQAIIPGVNFVG